MKNRERSLLILIVLIIGLAINFISNQTKMVTNNKQIIKEMNESTLETDLNNQINKLNAAHTEYMNYIQTCKTKIASAITDMGVVTSDQATLETMASNIRSISTSGGVYGSFTPISMTEIYNINLGFKPKALIIMNFGGSSSVWQSAYYVNSETGETVLTSGGYDRISWFDISITDNGFTFSLSKHDQASNQLNSAHYYIAI